MVWWQYVLFPFAVLYDLVTKARNMLYDREILKPIRFDTNVIGVGNLSVGGTGKTPMVAYLVDIFKKLDTPLSILSRGYGRNTTGFHRVTENETAKTVGDEPFMYARRYPDVGVFVDKERALAIPQLLFSKPDTYVILMDDSFQHRMVAPDLQLLLTSYQRPFYADYVLPAGRLRERRSEASRADGVVVTKCPADLTEAGQVRIKSEIRRYTDAPVFFTSVQYLPPVPFFGGTMPLQSTQIGISGIADHQPFEDYLEKKYSCRIIHHYRDHHRYTPLDVRHITNELDQHTSLLTTEKDMVKLVAFADFKNYSCYYIPIRVKFLRDEALFLSMVDSSLKKGAFEKDPL